MAMLSAPWLHPPTSPCPALSAEAEPISKGHCRKWHHKILKMKIIFMPDITGYIQERVKVTVGNTFVSDNHISQLRAWLLQYNALWKQYNIVRPGLATEGMASFVTTVYLPYLTNLGETLPICTSQTIDGTEDGKRCSLPWDCVTHAFYCQYIE